MDFDAFKSLLKGLMQDHPVFYSEAHLQYILARGMADQLAVLDHKWRVYLEEKIADNEGTSMNIDIVAEFDGVPKLAVEVKYALLCNKECSKKINDAIQEKTVGRGFVRFSEKGAGGENRIRYGFWKDLHRLENFIESKGDSVVPPAGYALFLTNNFKFLEKPGEKATDSSFSMDETQEIKARHQLCWIGKQAGKHPPLSFRKTYNLAGAWQSWGDPGLKFKYLLLSAGK